MLTRLYVWYRELPTRTGFQIVSVAAVVLVLTAVVFASGETCDHLWDEARGCYCRTGECPWYIGIMRWLRYIQEVF